MADNVNINVTENIDQVNVVASEIVEVVDLNLYATTEDVTINVTEEIIQVNINKVEASNITKTSDLINDGEDGINPFITLNDIPPVEGFVPYTGATQNVDLGEFELRAGQVTLDTSPTGTAAVATTRWNNTLGITETTLKGGSVVLKNGIDLVARVVNKVTPNTTLTKANYTAVRISGAQGQRLAVAYAQANNDLNSADTIGLVCETIPTNQEGFILTVGQLENINTTGSLQGETWNDGDVIYLSPTVAGKLTNIKPTAPQHIVIIGYVEYAHANNGKLYVKIMNGWELEELHNVSSTNYTTPIDTDSVLTYDVTNSLWKRLSWSNIKSNLKTYFDTIYQAALGFTPENVANKATDLTSPDNTKYPTTLVVSTALSGKQDSLGFTPENVANKSTNTSLGTSDTLYPTQNAVKVYADSKVTDAIVDGVTTVAPSQNAVFDALALKQNTLTNPITGTGASGQVAFFNGTTTQTGDNGLFWDNTNKRLGIGGGAIAPQNNLQVYGSNGTFALRVGQNTSNTDGASTGISFFNSTNVGGGNTATGQANIRVYRFSGGLGGEMEFNLGSTTLIRLVKEGNVAIGSTTAGARLDVRAQGALSTDVAFRVRNSADTANLMSVNGIGQTILTPTALTGTSATSALDIAQTWNTTGTPTLIKANVTNTASNASSTLLSLQSNSNNIFRVLNTGQVSIGTNNNIGLWVNDDGTNAPLITGRTLVFSHGLSSQAQNGFVFKGANNNLNATSGTQTLANFISGFNPTSGTSVFNLCNINGTINQTGGANGITRGLFINPTLTSAADFRAIEVSNGGAYINTTSVQASAILQADSTTKGFLPPRMTNAQRLAIASPAVGLIVYCTDVLEGLYINKSTGWTFII